MHRGSASTAVQCRHCAYTQSRQGPPARAIRAAVLWTRLPNGIPHSDAEFYELFGRKVRRLIQRKVIYGISREDAVAEVWARLLRARIVDKFVLNRLVYDPALTRDDFERYAYRAAYNHLANVFRTLARRSNREKALGEDYFEGTSSTGYASVPSKAHQQQREPRPSWSPRQRS